MSIPRRDSAPREDALDRAVKFAAGQAVFSGVRTLIPGLVERYDADTKRALVQPVIKQAFADGTTKPAAPILDVPVIQPSTGAFMLHLPILDGDIVAVVFSQTGLATFKAAWDGEGGFVEPVLGAAYSDAVAFPWGAHNYRPVSTEGIVLQSADGNAALIVKQDEIEMRVGRGRARLRSTNFDTWRA